MHRFVAILAVLLFVAPAAVGPVPRVQAGDWCIFPSGSSSRCSCPRCRAECDDEEDDDSCCGLAPPAGPVVTSIPAIMLAQSAVAVGPQRIEDALRTRYQRTDREKFVREVLDALERKATGRAQQQPQRAQIDAEQLLQLQQEVERLKRTTRQLVELLEEVKRQTENQ